VGVSQELIHSLLHSLVVHILLACSTKSTSIRYIQVSQVPWRQVADINMYLITQTWDIQYAALQSVITQIDAATGNHSFHRRNAKWRRRMGYSVSYRISHEKSNLSSTSCICIHHQKQMWRDTLLLHAETAKDVFKKDKCAQTANNHSRMLHNVIRLNANRIINVRKIEKLYFNSANVDND